MGFFRWRRRQHRKWLAKQEQEPQFGRRCATELEWHNYVRQNIPLYLGYREVAKATANSGIKKALAVGDKTRFVRWNKIRIAMEGPITWVLLAEQVRRMGGQPKRPPRRIEKILGLKHDVMSLDGPPTTAR